MIRIIDKMRNEPNANILQGSPELDQVLVEERIHPATVVEMEPVLPVLFVVEEVATVL